MYISEIIIDNYRNFEHIEIPLNKFTILIENDIGKSNVIEAIRLVLNNNTFQYSTKTLGITDINSNRLKKFKEDVKLQKAEISQAIQEYSVYSIDKVKGLEAKDSMFIINKLMSDYLLMKKTESNKELNYLYVALTRTSKNLILAINIEEGKNEIIDAIEKLGIQKYNYEI